MSEYQSVDIFSVRTWDQFRALLYIAVPLIIAATIETNTVAWIGLASAVLTPSLASWKSVTTLRTNLQAAIAASQLVLVGLHFVTETQFVTWSQIVLALIGGTIAAPNVYLKKLD